MINKMTFFKKFCFLLLLTMMGSTLIGCVPMVFIAGSGAGGVIASDKRSVKTMVQDRDRVNLALKRIGADPELREHTHIVVAGYNQVLLMVGQAETEALRNKAYDLVRMSSHVKRIYNEVTIEPPTSRMTQSNDTWITTKVKSAMLVEKGLHSGQVKVITEKSIVYLLGIVTPKQADLAAHAASQVPGVQKVVKLFEYEQ